MNIAYVLEDAGSSGGARVVLEHCKRLAARGHDITLFTVNGSDPHDWFDLVGVRVTCTGSYAKLRKALESYKGCKVATWWKTAAPVAESGGKGFYLIQDIETSYNTDPAEHAPVLATYELGLTHITEGAWVTERVKDAHCVGIGLDHEMFKPTGAERKQDMVLYCYRRHFLKGPDLFVSAFPSLRKKDVVTVGIENPPSIRIRHRGFVEDADLVGLYNSASVYVVTSTHEGFCLPALEAMACGCPVVTTNADGNMEFCIDGFNCLIVDRNPSSLVDAICEVCANPALAKQLAKEGLATAQRYQWDRVIDNLENVFGESGGE